MKIVGSLFGHPQSSADRWASGPRSEPGPSLDEGWGSDGACFLTRHGVVTACHLVVSNSWCYVEDGEADAVYRWVYEDVALVRTKVPPQLQLLELADRLPQRGEELTWWGLDDHWQPETGQVVASEVSPSRIVTTWVDGRMGVGDSGGPLLLPDGRVCGMMIREARYKLEYGGTLYKAIFVPSTEILRLVAMVRPVFG